jgi:hypothetical protein
MKCQKNEDSEKIDTFFNSFIPNEKVCLYELDETITPKWGQRSIILVTNYGRSIKIEMRKIHDQTFEIVFVRIVNNDYWINPRIIIMINKLMSNKSSMDYFDGHKMMFDIIQPDERYVFEDNILFYRSSKK